MDKGPTSKKGPSKVKLSKANVPVGNKRRELVRAISDQVCHCDNFSPCLSWIAHKKAGNVQRLFDSLKGTWGLPDEMGVWFNKTARKRWNDFKSKTLKPHYSIAKGDTAKAIRNRPEKYIGQAMWAELCRQFDKTKTKSEGCRKARQGHQVQHVMGRTSVVEWVAKYIKCMGVEPSIPVVFDKVYMKIDPLGSRQVDDSDTDGDDDEVVDVDTSGAASVVGGNVASAVGVGVDPVVSENVAPVVSEDVSQDVATTVGEDQAAAVMGQKALYYPEAFQISESLHKAYDDALGGGKSITEANNLCLQVIGKTNTQLNIEHISSRVLRRNVGKEVAQNQEEMLKLKEEVRRQNNEMETLHTKLNMLQALMMEHGMSSSSTPDA